MRLRRMNGSAGLSEAGQQLQTLADQLNAMEMLEQQLNELDSILADAQDLQNDMFSEQSLVLSELWRPGLRAVPAGRRHGTQTSTRRGAGTRRTNRHSLPETNGRP